MPVFKNINDKKVDVDSLDLIPLKDREVTYMNKTYDRKVYLRKDKKVLFMVDDLNGVRVYEPEEDNSGKVKLIRTIHHQNNPDAYPIYDLKDGVEKAKKLKLDKTFKISETQYKNKKDISGSYTDARRILGESVITEDKESVEKDIDSVVKKIAEQTDENDHTGARMTLAKFLKATKYEKILKHIMDIHDIERSMPSELIKYTNILTKEMIKLAEQEYGKEIAEKINGAF